MFSKILIANRGEIACRVIRTARNLGYRTVAVFSDADRDAPHVAMADEAVHIGGSPAAESYLRIDAILGAARKTGADAVHPGYGFLSENAAFAQACVDAGLVFIGPPASAITAMGDKALAKRRMLDASVPCAPGYLGSDQSDATLVAEAEKLGFPLLVKAVAGGGGRGMRLLLANVLTSNLDKQSFLDLVSATNPDAICVQEADDAWGDALKSLEERYPLHAIVPRSDNFGIAFYTRLPGRMSGVLFQREHDVPALAATVEVEGQRFSILDVHAVPPLGTVMAERRNQHLSAIRAWIEAQSDPVILLGDLNLTMYSPEYRRFTRGLGLQNARQGFGPLGTWPTWVPFARLPLDQCLLRGDLAVVSCAIGPDIGSDHLPLIVDLHIAPK